MNGSRAISGLVILVAGGGWLVHYNPVGTPASSRYGRPEAPELVRLRAEGNRLFAVQQYEAAAEIYQQGYQKSLGRHQTGSAIRFLTNLAGCYFGLSRYQKAAELYLEARRLARPIGFAEALGMSSLNLAGIYLQMGDAEAAARAAEQGVEDLRSSANVSFRARLLVQLGNARRWSGRPEQALSILRESYWEADKADDVAMLALSQDYAGSIALARGDLAATEAAYLNAYLIRRLRKPDEIHYSHANLGRLRLAQGDFRAAENLFSLGLEKARCAPSLVQVWTLYHGRGTAREGLGKLAEALSDFESAVELARRWRADAVAADALRIRADAGLHEVYQSYIRAAAQAALVGARTELARRAFAVAEEQRAVSLRELWNATEERRRKLPDGYWAALAQLQSTAAAAFREPSSQAAARAGQLQLRLIEMEVEAGAPRPLARSVAGVGYSYAIQRRLGPSEALFSFSFGERESYLWAVTREEFALHALRPKRELAPLISRFREGVRRGTPEAVAAGREVYSRLFGAVRPSVASKAHWMVVLDDALFEAPLAAAVTGPREGRPVYLAENHSLLVVPSAAALLEPPRPGQDDGGGPMFVGLGDPVYNRADPRWPRVPATTPPTLELPRLVASAAEIRGCARSWGGKDAVLLEGPAACRDRLVEALGRHPAVLHLATHVLTPPDRREGALIALSLGLRGTLGVLTTTEIASLGSARLVVLSGCSSGAGMPLPGAGLVGLTRAWLAAGAERVVASLWPTPDDSGEIFLSFYRHISQNPREASVAMRRAQLEMLRSSGWRCAPRYWAAYVVTGKG